MKNVIPFPDQAGVREEAAAWVARLDGDPLSATERAELRTWLERDVRHGEALQELARLWGEMDALSVLAELFPLTAERKVAESGSWTWLRAHAQGAVVATLIGVGVLLGGSAGFQFLAPAEVAGVTEPVELVYQTETGQQSSVVLKDGSTLLLNTRSQVRVRFDERERAVYLSEGEAHFDVAKNPQRPFVVYAGHGQVRAIGTAFSVRVEGERVAVVVSEGTVQVVASGDGSARLAPEGGARAVGEAAVTLGKGGVANYVRAIEVAAYPGVKEIEQRLAWRGGKWVFAGETLAEVIHEVSRYTDQRIEIVDPGLAELRVGGYFDIGEIDALLGVLQAGFGVRATRVNGDLIQLSALDGQLR